MIADSEAVLVYPVAEETKQNVPSIPFRWTLGGVVSVPVGIRL